MTGHKKPVTSLDALYTLACLSPWQTHCLVPVERQTRHGMTMKYANCSSPGWDVPGKKGEILSLLLKTRTFYQAHFFITFITAQQHHKWESALNIRVFAAAGAGTELYERTK